MFGLIATLMAMTVPATNAGMGNLVEGRMADTAAENGLAGMWYEAFVAPDGKIEDCHVRALIGDADAAQAVCRELIGRRAKPGLAPDGQPAHGWMLGSLTFADNIRAIPRGLIEPNIVISAPEVDDAKRVDLTVLVGTDGGIEACEGRGALSTGACEELQTVAMPVRKARSGEVVRYIYPIIVEYRPARG